MRRRIAVLGGAGFIGSSVAKHLEGKFQVRILDVRPPPEDSKISADYVDCDVRDYFEVVNGLDGVDVAIHAAIVQIPLINENKRLGYEVNLVGTQNVCKAVEENVRIKGMILAGTWHTIGERDLQGMIDEEFGFRPDKVEDRARLYALSKMAQEAIVRYYDETSKKIYGIIRMGTVLGNSMPLETAASIFIRRGLSGEPITPFRHSMYRPMLYADIRDVCKAYENYVSNILSGRFEKGQGSLAHIVNVYYPQPITILDVAHIVRKAIIKYTNGKVTPEVEILDKGVPILFKENDKDKIRVSLKKAKKLLNLKELASPEESIMEVIKLRLQ